MKPKYIEIVFIFDTVDEMYDFYDYWNSHKVNRSKQMNKIVVSTDFISRAVLVKTSLIKMEFVTAMTDGYFRGVK